MTLSQAKLSLMKMSLMIDKFFDLKKEVVVITGASGQLGVAYSQALLEVGAKVFGLDQIKNDKVEKLENKYSDSYLFEIGDVTSKTKLSNNLATLKEKLGKPSVLINNAAIDVPPGKDTKGASDFESFSEEIWDKTIDVNLKGTFLTCQVIGSEMAREGGGSIININSIYGLLSPDQSIYEYKRKLGEDFYKPVAYSASKSGVLNLTRYLATYWAKKNVRVNSLTLAGVFNNQDADFLQNYTQRIPIGRMAKVEDYLGPILFLASDASSYMTGANLVVDGGWTAI